MSDGVRHDIWTMPALGRPFMLGSLYDGRTETLIPGESLWGPEKLKNFSTQNMQGSSYGIKASENFADRASLLGLSENYELSVLCDLIEVSGSGEYLNDWHSKNFVQRVTLHYHMKGRFEELNMGDLARVNIQYEQHFRHECPATHVTTGIQYGGKAYVVFEKTISDDDLSTLSVRERMEEVIGWYLDWDEDTLEISEKDKEFTDSFSCRFYGDFQPSSIPTTFKQAIQLCKSIPEKLAEAGGTPQTISLYPLVLIDPRASEVKQIVPHTVFVLIKKMLEQLNDIIHKSDKIRHTAQKNGLFQSIIDELQTFKVDVQEYRSLIIDCLRQVVPQVRNGTREIRELEEIVTTNDRTVFDLDKIEAWLNKRNEEVQVISEYLKYLPGNMKICKTEADFSALINDPNFAQVYILMIEHENVDKELESLKKYIIDHAAGPPIPVGKAEGPPAVEVIKKFKVFIETHGEDYFGFGAFDKEDGTTEIEASVAEYKDGVSVDEDYEKKL